MWVCARCRSNNELAACWRCGAPASEAAVPPAAPPPLPAASPPLPVAPPVLPAPQPAFAAPAGYASAAPWGPPGAYPPYGLPGWAPAPPRSSAGRRIGIGLVAVAGAVIAAVVILTVVGRQVSTLTTPTAIAGERQLTATPLATYTDGASQQLKDLGAASTVVAVYGAGGAPQHLVVAASGRLDGTNDEFVNGVVTGAGTAGASIDSGQLTHVTFGGAQYTCGAATKGTVSMPFCAWWGGGDAGAVFALPGASGDLLAYTEQARRAVEGS